MLVRRDRLPETNSNIAPENRPSPKRKFLFKPLIFRGVWRTVCQFQGEKPTGELNQPTGELNQPTVELNQVTNSRCAASGATAPLHRVVSEHDLTPLDVGLSLLYGKDASSIHSISKYILHMECQNN